jgi:hypothetical protein
MEEATEDKLILCILQPEESPRKISENWHTLMQQQHARDRFQQQCIIPGIAPKSEGYEFQLAFGRSI